MIKAVIRRGQTFISFIIVENIETDSKQPENYKNYESLTPRGARNI